MDPQDWKLNEYEDMLIQIGRDIVSDARLQYVATGALLLLARRLGEISRTLDFLRSDLDRRNEPCHPSRLEAPYETD